MHAVAARADDKNESFIFIRWLVVNSWNMLSTESIAPSTLDAQTDRRPSSSCKLQVAEGFVGRASINLETEYSGEIRATTHVTRSEISVMCDKNSSRSGGS